MGFGATPHRKGARGAAPNPASFLKRKRERRIAENDVFGRKDYRFCGNTFPLGEKSGFKLKLYLSKALLIS